MPAISAAHPASATATTLVPSSDYEDRSWDHDDLNPTEVRRLYHAPALSRIRGRSRPSFNYPIVAFAASPCALKTGRCRGYVCNC